MAVVEAAVHMPEVGLGEFSSNYCFIDRLIREEGPSPLHLSHWAGGGNVGVVHEAH